MKRVTQSIKIDPNLWIKVKIHVAKASMKISDYVESLIKKDLNKF